jgi:predicted dehydrogenase/aryl-alcohol dehydrogenase-like predicted oxidoreductase
MANHLRWGVLGAGGIADTFAKALPQSRTGRLAAVGSRDGAKAAAFTAKHGGARAHGSYEALLVDPEVDAVYIATPHPQHAEWCIRAARAGKHILCEKPITLNHAEAMVVADAAREAGVFMMEAFMYRCHPQTQRLTELIRSGAIGEVRMIQATFSFQAGFNADGRLFSNELGGGGILDVGCYTTSIARLVAGAATGQPFANPSRVDGRAVLHPKTGVDLHAAAVAEFPGGILAHLATGVMLNQENCLRVFGSAGSIHVPSPFVPSQDTTLLLKREGQEAPETIATHSDTPLYALEADAVGDAISRGERESSFMSVLDTLGNMAALDAWRRSAGFVYTSEQPEANFPTISRQPLRKRSDATMPYLNVPGVALPVSRLVMGCDNQSSMPHAAAMFDDYFERGGNTFDTAFVYGGGQQERLLGRWLRQRNMREQAVVIVKGAHTPHCTPEWLTNELEESLDRLQTDHGDIYLMHRDNLDVPVGEFVDVLNEHARAGRFRAFGGSNWTLGRLREARAYAEKKGLQPFHCVSNNFSLARMVSPVWAGCVSAAEPSFKQWLSESKTTLLAWSSQSRGFFTERAHPDRRDDAELVRCWYSDDNFHRRKRAVELARLKGVQPINIALAYVLNQPFAACALIGPRFISETVSTFGAVGLALTPGEMNWLNLETDKIPD